MNLIIIALTIILMTINTLTIRELIRVDAYLQQHASATPAHTQRNVVITPNVSADDITTQQPHNIIIYGNR